MVVISGDNNKHIQNQLKIEEFPIDIQKFIEIINVQFLKNKFNQQNNVKTGRYSINLINSANRERNENNKFSK